MSNIIILFLGGLLGLLVSIIQSTSQLKRISQIHRIASFSVDENNPTDRIGEVAGRVVPDGRNLHSPFSQTDCVLWHAEVLEKRSSGDNAEWETILNETSAHPFEVLNIKDSIRMCRIYPKDAELMLHDDLYKESGPLVGTLEPNLMKAISRLPISLTESTGSARSLRVHEQVIKAGETVYILGKIKEREGVLVISSSQDGSPFLISDRSQCAVLVTLYGRVITSAILFTILGILIAQLITNYR